MSFRARTGLIATIGALAACDAGKPMGPNPTGAAPEVARHDLSAVAVGREPSLSGVVSEGGMGSALQASAFDLLSGRADDQHDDLTGVGPNVRVHDLSVWPRNETTMSVDRRNPLRLVASANDYSSVPRTGDSSCGAYASTDGGATWQDVGTGFQPVAFPASGDPATAFDENGSAYFVCLSFDRRTNASGIFVSRSRDLRTLSAMTPVITTAGSTGLFNDKEYVTVDVRDDSPFRGRVYVTWTQFDFRGPGGRYLGSPILISSSSDGGVTWSEPHAVTTPELNDNQGSVPAVGRNGELLVVFENFDTPTIENQVMVARSTDGGQTFGAPEKVDDLYDVCPRFVAGRCSLDNSTFRVNSFPSIAVAEDGKAVVVWSDSRGGRGQIRYSSSSSGKKGWSASALVSPNETAADQIFPWVTMDDDGRAHVVYYDRRDDPNNYLLNTYVSSQRGRSFGAAVRVTGVSSDPRNDGFGGRFIGDYIGIAASEQRIHPLWTDTRRGTSEVMTAAVAGEKAQELARRRSP